MNSVLKKTMPCSECAEKFSEDDVRLGKYFPSTMTCRGCYTQMQNLPHTVSCFGKVNRVKKGKIVGYGYDPAAPECSQECPDRKICKAFVRAYEAEKTA
jgi:hypothetical protein